MTELTEKITEVLDIKTEKILPINIRKGINIYGVTGTLEEGISEEELEECIDISNSILGIPKRTDLEYITIGKGAILSSDIAPSSKIKIQAKFLVDGITGGSIIGIPVSTSESKAFRLFNANGQCYLDYGGGERYGRINGGTMSANVAYNVEFDNKYVKNLDTGVNIISGSTQSSFNYSEYKICCNDRDMLVGIRLYYLKIYEEGTLVTSFIPVKDSDEVTCFYDEVTENYYYNAGTGNFTPGPEKEV